MHVLNNDMTVFFDIDDTLVLWDIPEDKKDRCIEFNKFGIKVKLLPHLKHIEQIKRHAARGHIVICWSAGGVKWCKEVIKKLKLESYVTLVMCKPQFYYDDLEPQEFLPLSKRIYNPNT